MLRSTYRVQLHAGFTFDDAAEIVPYLARLGVSHLYCSPVLQAAPGSTHGYDVVDHSRLSDDLGGASAFDRLTRRLAEHDLSILLDIVPNHMALAGAANRWWWDVLEEGPGSPYAAHFDIDWDDPEQAPAPTVLAPVLGDHYGRVLEAGGLRLVRSAGSFSVRYEDHELPISLWSLREVVAAAAERCGSTELGELAGALGSDEPSSRPSPKERDELRHRLRSLAAADATVAEALDAELAAVERDPDALDGLLSRQCYRLANWRTASQELDYRRFFDITSLVGLRAEDGAVFEDTHALVLDLVREGHVTGLRVDHVDGLRDPTAYLERLRAAAPTATLVVEKILADDEHLPEGWPVSGTSGYDFVGRVGDLFVDEAQLGALDAAYADLTGDDRSFAEVAAEAKAHVMANELAAETERLTDLLVEVCRPRRRHRDHTRQDLRDVVTEVAAAMAVYRTYVSVEGATPADRQRIGQAVDSVRASRPDVDGELLDLLRRVLEGDEPGATEQELALRFQQLSAPVMAKGVEDTAFYRHARLLATNEVGADPGRAGQGVAAFHAHNRHIADAWPGTLLTLSTHDTKRSADVRARLALLSELPVEWAEAVRGWRALTRPHRRDGWPEPVTELIVYQSLLGAWPIDPERLVATIGKSVNEAKVHTSWRQRDEQYESAVADFVADAAGDPRLGSAVEGFLHQHDLVRLGRLTSLAQVTLLLTCPGVPDLYQGDELWDLSLVDPDNRRPVDFTHRVQVLDRVAGTDPAAALDELATGGTKLWLIHRLLEHRRRHPEHFAGGYQPLAVEGTAARHAVAFTRGDLVTVVPRLLVGLGRSGWGDTTVRLPAGGWRCLLGSGEAWSGEVAAAALLADRPVAVLERAPR